MAGISFGVSTESYFSSLSPSFTEGLASDFQSAGAAGFTDSLSFDQFSTTQDVSFYTDAIFGVDESLTLPGREGLGALTSPPAWTFITAPEDISWDIANNASRIDMFGTNNPPVVAGSRGMRDLSLSNSLVEGFIRGVNVEGKVAALENLMRYDLNSSDGFVSVPVYQVWANEKSYGGPEAYYIIKDVKVKEAMRDLTGNATRAYVDISLMQVPAYQVNSGRDQASATTSGVKSGLLSQAQVNAAQAAQGKGSTTAATNAANQGVGTGAKPAAGPGVGTPAQPPKPSTVVPLNPTQAPKINTAPSRPN